MLCYIMLCYVMLCYVMLYYVMLCYVMLCYVFPYYIILYSVQLYRMEFHKTYIYMLCYFIQGDSLARGPKLLFRGLQVDLDMIGDDVQHRL
jgi:hypothetical protein